MTQDDPLAPPEGYGQRAGRMPGGAQTQLIRPADTSCDICQPWFSGGVPVRCGRKGVLRLVIGCPNEHLGIIDLCAPHKAEGLMQFPAECHRCTMAGTPARCTIITRETIGDDPGAAARGAREDPV